MNINQFKNIYFIGIGGIGMSALARWFLHYGFQVAGYDKTKSDLTKQLTIEGMDIHYEDNLNLIPPIFINSPSEKTLIIYTPAVPKNHSELQYFENQGFTIKKRAEVLGLITRNFFTIAVAGTHGKTTTSSMIAHILQKAGKPCVAFLGGILKNYDSNLLLPPTDARPEDTWVVVEADEYDKSFLHLKPNVSIITSIEADHLDIYGDAAHIEKTFAEFAQKTQANGKLFLKKGIGLNTENIHQSIDIQYYSVNEPSDLRAKNLRIEKGRFYFDWQSKTKEIKDLSLAVVGFHNVENATVAIAVAQSLGIDTEAIREAIGNFQGAKRRFDFIIREENLVFADDYAHHPTEVRALLTSARALYPDKKITVIFQPHLFTRTRDFMDDFAESLSLADNVILLEIYPARELPIEGINSTVLLNKITSPYKKIVAKELILNELAEIKPEVLFTVGAGDVDRLIPSIKNFLLGEK